jgi:hypothetical protein
MCESCNLFKKLCNGYTLKPSQFYAVYILRYNINSAALKYRAHIVVTLIKKFFNSKTTIMKMRIKTLLMIFILFGAANTTFAQKDIKVKGDSADDANSDNPSGRSHTTYTIIHTGHPGTPASNQNSGTTGSGQSSNASAADTGGGSNNATPNNSPGGAANSTATTDQTANTNCSHFCWGWLGLLGLLGLGGLIKRNPDKT